MKRFFRKIKSSFKFFTVFLLIAVFAFSSWLPVFEIKQALAAAPTFVAAGPFTGGIGSLPVSLPSGIVADDILLLFIETANEAISITNQNGGIWEEVVNSPQGTGTADDVAATRLTVFWSRYNGTQGGPTINDSGNHQIARIIAVRGTISSGNPIDVATGGVEAVADTSGVIPGAITTVDEAFVVTAIATALPDANSSTVFSGWANANLTNVIEQTDNAKNSGNGGGLGVATGVKTTAGNYGDTTVDVSDATAKAMLSIALKSAAAPLTTLTVGVSGSQTSNLDSGISNTWLGGAFTFSINTGSANVTNIKVSNNGTSGNLSDIRLFYDTNNNGYDVGDSCFNTSCGDGQGGTLGTGINGALSLLSGNTYYIYVVADIPSSVNGGLTVDLQITNPSTDIATDASNIDTNPKNITGSTTIRPNVASYDNASESALNNLGARNGQNITVNGTGFGTLCASVSVKVDTSPNDITLTCNSANNTTISATIPSAQTTTYGGVGSNGLLVTINGTADDVRQDFYIYPDVTAAPGGDAGRETENITIGGTRFGVTEGTVTFTGGFGSIVVSDTDVTWADTSITAIVPVSIADNVYLGDIRITRASDTGSKDDLVYGGDVFRILPRIIGFNPTSQVEGSAVEIIGNHLCQAGAASCPAVLDANNKVTFYNAVDATIRNSWVNGDSSTVGVNVNVPAGAETGNVVVKSNGYDSNSLSGLTVQKKPNTPTRDEPLNGANTGTLTPILKTTGTDPNTDDVQYKIEIATNSIFTVGLQTFDQTILQTGWSGQNSGGGTRYTSGTQGVYTVQSALVCGTTYYWRTYAKDPLGSNQWSNTQGTDQTFITEACNQSPTLAVTQPDGVGDTVNAGDLYNITYDLSDPDNVVTVDFYYDNNNFGLDGTQITGCQNQPEGAGATCSWDTTGMSAGDYYIYGRDVNDGINPEVTDYSPGVITISAPAQVVASSAGTQISNIDAGDTTTKYLGAAFRFQQAGGSADTITALTISETGSVNANAHLSANSGIRYETGVSSCTYNGTETFVADTFDITTDKMTLTGLNIPVTLGPTNYTCVYVVFDVSASAVGGQTIDLEITSTNDFTLQNSTTKAGTYPVQLAGSTVIMPNVTSITSYPNATQKGGQIGQTVQISGAGFGTSCSVASGNKVSIGAYDLSCTGATFNNTIISIAIDSGITSYGGTGASGLLVTIGNIADDIRQEYHILPKVTSWPGGDAAKENDSVTFGGSRFGATQGTVSFTGGFAGKSASITGWSDTSITVTAPTTIDDNVYLGDITITRAADTNSKYTTAYGGNVFRILPRIIQLNPNTASVGESVIIIGNHFCQTGTCPIAGNRSTASDNVKFYNNIQVSDANVTAWGHGDSTTSGVTVNVPAGTATGNVVVRSNDYNSNGVNFTIISAIPNDPASLGQFRNSGYTDSISVGGAASSTTIYFQMTMEVFVSGGTLFPQIEVKPIGTAFTNTYTAEGAGQAGPGPVTGQISTTLTTNTKYHWQARVRHNKSAADYYSNWVSFGGNIDPNDVDFYIDTTAPTMGSCPFHSSITSSGATISWVPNDAMSATFTKQVQYSTDSNFTSSTCVPGSTCGTPISGYASGSQLVNLTGLGPNTAYYYRVRSKDEAGNEAINGYGLSGDTACTFTTSKAETRTTEFYIITKTDSLGSGSEYTAPFTVYISESDYSIQSVFIEMSGVFSTDATPGTGSDVKVRVNSQPDVTYTIGTSDTVTTPFNIIHQVSAANLSVATPSVPNNSNTFGVTVMEGGRSITVVSAKIVVTYYHTPVQ